MPRESWPQFVPMPELWMADGWDSTTGVPHDYPHGQLPVVRVHPDALLAPWGEDEAADWKRAFSAHRYRRYERMGVEARYVPEGLHALVIVDFIHRADRRLLLRPDKRLFVLQRVG